MEDNLLSILEDGKQKLELLVKLAEEKQQAIVENRRDAVAKLSEQELELTESLQAGNKTGCKMGQIKLKDSSEADDATGLSCKFERGACLLTEKLTTLNKNAELLKHALAYTEYCSLSN